MVLIKSTTRIEIIATDSKWKIIGRRIYFGSTPHIVRLLSKLRKKGFRKE